MREIDFLLYAIIYIVNYIKFDFNLLGGNLQVWLSR
jgi:hypothetical protein